MRKRVFALTVKAFLALLKDKKSRLVVVVPPLVQLLVFGYAATFDLKNVPFAVYNEDSGTASRELLARFRGSQNFTEVATIRNEQQISGIINRQEALLVVHIGPEFSRTLAKGGTGSVQVIVDGRNSNTAMLALNYLRTIVHEFNRIWIGRPPASPPLEDPALSRSGGASRWREWRRSAGTPKEGLSR